MMAVVCNKYGSMDGLVVQPLPDPIPQQGQVRVHVRAAGVNYPDALQVLGRHQYRPEPPFLLGRELAGIVDAIGPGGSQFVVGQRVYGAGLEGAFADVLAVDAARLRPIPDHFSFEEAAGLSTTYGTAYYALVSLARLRKGETVLVLGSSGGVGLAAVEIAKAIGARVIAAVSSGEKLAVCAAAGADVLIDYAAGDLRQRLREEATSGLDVVCDPVGGAFAEVALRGLAWRGRYLTVGFASGEIPKIPLNLVLLKGAEVLGVSFDDTGMREPDVTRAINEGMAALISSGKIRPHVSARYPLTQVAEALNALLERRSTGKIVLLPDMQA